jgi:hypothetical protein
MKKLVFSFLLIFNSIMVFSQLAPWETTLEEYNYITKGYAVQLEQGLDMKAGYEFNDYLMGFGTPYIINTGDGGKISIELKLLINKTKEHPNRALMVIYKYENEEGLKFDSPGFYYRYLCIPNNAEIYGLTQDLWNKYFEDIKSFDQNDLIALTWALSKIASFNNLGCFPENSLIAMADGSEKKIKNIAKGDTVSSYSFEKQSIEPTIVDELLVHSNRMYEISKINISISDNLTASLNDFLSPSITLEATNNHPVFTNNGIKNFGDLDCNDKIYFYSKELQKVILCNVTSKEKNIKSIPKVYNLKLLNSDNFIVNSTIVKTK